MKGCHKSDDERNERSTEGTAYKLLWAYFFVLRAKHGSLLDPTESFKYFNKMQIERLIYCLSFKKTATFTQGIIFQNGEEGQAQVKASEEGNWS